MEVTQRIGRVVVTEFISLDGVIHAPGDPSEYERGGWATGGGQPSMDFKFEELMSSDPSSQVESPTRGLPTHGHH